MNELRNQLQRARHTYAAAQYPGDLASEVLPAPRRSITRWAIVGSAIAAAIIVSLIVLDDAPEPFDVATVRLTSSSPREGVPISLELPPMPAMPTNIG